MSDQCRARQHLSTRNVNHSFESGPVRIGVGVENIATNVTFELTPEGVIIINKLNARHLADCLIRAGLFNKE